VMQLGGHRQASILDGQFKPFSPDHPPLFPL
jgi:hypothetical protein